MNTQPNALTESDISAIITAAERNNAAHPPSALGITLEEAREKRGLPDPEGEALRKGIRSLSHDARLELMALIALGRGDAPEGGFADYLAHAKQSSDENDVAYIVGKSPSLPIYLRTGLDRLKSKLATVRGDNQDERAS